MFANRFTALTDACVLARPLKRNLLLTLAEAEFFRVRWSTRILDETESAIGRMLLQRGFDDALLQARRARANMEKAFEDGEVTGYEGLLGNLESLPDPNDVHVIEAARKTEASVIVTDNLKHFPERILQPLNLEAKSADAFIADTIDLDAGKAVAAIRMMRERLKKPEKTAEVLLLNMEAAGLTQTVDILRGHSPSL